MTSQTSRAEWDAPAADLDAIRQTALDYIESWYAV